MISLKKVFAFVFAFSILAGGFSMPRNASAATWAALPAAGVHAWSSVAASADGTILAAVDLSGSLYRSTNRGVTWAPITVSDRLYLVAASADGTRLAAASWAGYIYTSTDSGATWTRATLAGDHTWTSLAYSADGSTIVASSGSTGDHFVAVSRDSGTTWRMTNPNMLTGAWTWKSVAVSGNGMKLFAAMSVGDIYMSTDGGVLWSQIPRTTQNWYKIVVSNDGSRLWGILSDIGGSSLMMSRDGGVTWVVRDRAGVRSWNGLATDSTGSKVALTTSYAGDPVYVSVDGDGMTWALYPISDPVSGKAVALSGDGITVLAGGSTVTGGRSGSLWIGDLRTGLSNSGSGSDSNPGDVSITLDPKPVNPWTARCMMGPRMWRAVASSSDGRKLVAVENPGSVWLSTDFGVTWRENTAGILSAPMHWSSVASSADGTRLVATTNNDLGAGLIYTSSDSGLTWTSRPGAGSREWTSVASSNVGKNLVAVSGGDHGRGTIWTSADYGVTWTQRVLAGVPALLQKWTATAISADGTKLAIAEYASTIADAGDVWVSVDSGATWRQQVSASHPTAWTALANSTDFKRLVGSVSGGSLSTGTFSTGSEWNWTVQPGATADWSSVASSSDGSKVLAGVFSGKLYIGTLVGSTWTWTAQPDIAAWRGVASSYDGSRLVAVAQNGCIWTLYTPVKNPKDPGDLALTRTLQIGSTGNDVRALQAYLVTMKYLTAAPTGYFGAMTKAAVAKLQAANGLAAVGSVGPKTIQLLNTGVVSSGSATASSTGTVSSGSGFTEAQKKSILDSLSASGGAFTEAQKQAILKVLTGGTTSESSTEAPDKSSSPYGPVLSAPPIVMTVSAVPGPLEIVFTGTVNTSGRPPVLDGGFVYGGSIPPATLPFTYPRLTPGPSGDGVFTRNYFMSYGGLLCGGYTYYMRAYARNSVGTSFGEPVSFTTAPCVTAPTLTTNAASGYFHWGAQLNATVTSLGTTGPITERGFEYGTTSGTYPLVVRETGSFGAGAFMSLTSSDLLPPEAGHPSVYYYRAYVVTSAGTVYGAERSFSFDTINPTTVQSTGLVSATTTTATVKGTLFSTVPGTFTTGIQWGTDTSYSGGTLSYGAMSTPGAYTVTISGLASRSAYHWRAWFDDSTGFRRYASSDLTFTTL